MFNEISLSLVNQLNDINCERQSIILIHIILKLLNKE